MSTFTHYRVNIIEAKAGVSRAALSKPTPTIRSG